MDFSAVHALIVISFLNLIGLVKSQKVYALA